MQHQDTPCSGCSDRNKWLIRRMRLLLNEVSERRSFPVAYSFGRAVSGMGGSKQPALRIQKCDRRVQSLAVRALFLRSGAASPDPHPQSRPLFNRRSRKRPHRSIWKVGESGCAAQL